MHRYGVHRRRKRRRTRLSSRLGTNASSSSKKTTQGDDARARENTCLTARSLSPTYYPNAGDCQPGPSQGPADGTHLVQQLWSLDANEICLGLVGHRFRQQCLPTPRRTPEQDATSGFDPDSAKQLWSSYWLDDRHLEFFPYAMQRTNVRPRDIWDGCETFSF